MAGANLVFKVSPQTWSRLQKALGWRSIRGPRSVSGHLCAKAGVPVDDTALDDPGKVGVICLDETNDDVYICTAYTDSTTHTWTKITP